MPRANSNGVYLLWLASKARFFFNFSISTFFVFSFNLDLPTRYYQPHKKHKLDNVEQTLQTRNYFTDCSYNLLIATTTINGLTSCSPVGFYGCSLPAEFCEIYIQWDPWPWALIFWLSHKSSFLILVPKLLP